MVRGGTGVQNSCRGEDGKPHITKGKRLNGGKKGGKGDAAQYPGSQVKESFINLKHFFSGGKLMGLKGDRLMRGGGPRTARLEGRSSEKGSYREMLVAAIGGRGVLRERGIEGKGSFQH